VTSLISSLLSFASYNSPSQLATSNVMAAPTPSSITDSRRDPRGSSPTDLARGVNWRRFGDDGVLAMKTGSVR
jgi:hypothetical protein